MEREQEQKQRLELENGAPRAFPANRLARDKIGGGNLTEGGGWVVSLGEWGGGTV